MNKTKIPWVKNPDGSQGYTWNPITGCLNGCEYCYARRLAKTRLKDRYLANDNLAPTVGEGVTPLHTSQLIDSLDPFYPRLWEDRLGDIPHDWTTLAGRQHVKPRGIFICDMSDLFGIGIPHEWTKAVMTIIDFAYQHRFYLLTKQPQNLIKFSPFPDNCWVGVSVTDFGQLYYSPQNLYGIEAKVKYISAEPLLGSLAGDTLELMMRYLNWVIIGSQTKPYKPPKMKWIDEIVSACDKASIPVFLKNNLRPLFEEVFGGCRVYSSPALDKQGNLRQELPK